MKTSSDQQPLMHAALLKIMGMANNAVDSDGEVFLSENAIYDISQEALSGAVGSHTERAALENIFLLAVETVAFDKTLPEIDIFNLCEEGLKP